MTTEAPSGEAAPQATLTASEQPRDGDASGQQTGRAALVKLLRRLSEANVFVVTVLAIFSALVLGAILILVTTPAVLHAWGSIGSRPKAAFSTSWRTIAGAYSAMFEGSLFAPSAISHAVSTGHGWTTALTPSPRPSYRRRHSSSRAQAWRSGSPRVSSILERKAS